MIQCSQCNFTLAADASVCPRCGEAAVDEVTSVGHQANERMIKLARFTNAAEAGYFAHELASRSRIESQVLVEEDFDAISGFWSTRFALLVHEADLASARDMLQRMIADDEYGENELETTETGSWRDPVSSDADYDLERPRFEIVDPRDLQDDPTVEAGVNWIPIVLTLAAGSVVFWGVRKIHEEPKPAVMAAPRGHHRGDLWDELTRDKSPWVQRLSDGVGIRELRIDSDRHAIIVREDLNGDGVYEHEMPYERAALQR